MPGESLLICHPRFSGAIDSLISVHEQRWGTFLLSGNLSIQLIISANVSGDGPI